MTERKEKRYEVIPFSDEMFPVRIMWDKILDIQHDGHIHANKWHEQIEILHFKAGMASVECGFCRYLCGEGDIVIINPCEVHSVTFHSGAPRYDCIIIDERLYSGNKDLGSVKYISGMKNHRLHFNNLISHNAKARSIIQDLMEECQKKETAYEVVVKGDILRLLAVLFRTELRDVAPVGNMERDTSKYAQITPALRYIAENYTTSITLEQLVGVCCMNRSYFCRRFKAITGQTAIEYINLYRIAKAEAMLLVTNLSISEIAARSGFSNSGYFTRKFHESHGCSPKAYIPSVPPRTAAPTWAHGTIPRPFTNRMNSTGCLPSGSVKRCVRKRLGTAPGKAGTSPCITTPSSRPSTSSTLASPPVSLSSNVTYGNWTQV